LNEKLYVVTSNHIHLLAYASGGRETIPRSMQLLAGRTAQEFNLRKGRKGAFWEDRYHATAVECGEHLRSCMTYIDMNMVRAGAVAHPGGWDSCGYNEVQTPPRRYHRIDRGLLARLLELPNEQAAAEWQEKAVAAKLAEHSMSKRCPEWTESVAVGGKRFLDKITAELDAAVRHRTVEPLAGGGMVLREQPSPYSPENDGKNACLSSKNTVLWKINS
jgi:hypothetical protein